MSAGSSDFVTTPDGVRLFRRIVGEGDRWLVMPGVGSELDFEPLARRRRVAFFDIRNRGRSDPVGHGEPVGFPIEVDDVDTVRASLGAERVDVLGWSYVGLVVALYAAHSPEHVDHLVMACPAPPAAAFATPPREPNADLVAGIEALYEQGLEERDPVAFAREWRRIVTPTRMGDPSAFARLQADPSEWPNEWPGHMTAALQRVFATHPPDFDYRREASMIKAPTLIVHGAADSIPLSATEAWAAAIPMARLVVLPGVGHFPHAEAPDAFFDAVQAFLDGP